MTDTTTQTEIPIAELREELNGEVITPGDPAYDEARRVYTPLVDRRPAVIVRPVGADEVARVVTLARETGLELAVRSGGHSAAGHGVSEGGIVLDLSLMHAVSVDREHQTAWLETGLTAGEATNALAEHGLAVGFGDTASVGIGGLTLGGGVGFLVRRYGLTADDVLAADVVTADGEILRADGERHPDLFWAIRGGGGNFGVVTRIRFRPHPLTTVTGGMLVLPASTETIAGFVEAAEAAPEELSTIAGVMKAPPMPFIPESHHGELVILAMIVHAGAPDDAEGALAPFRALATPIVDMLRAMPYPEIYPPEDSEFRPLAVGRNLFLERIDRSVAETILDHLRSSTAFMPVTQIRVLGGAMARVPAGATAYAHRASPIMVNVGAVFATPEERPVHEEWVAGLAGALQQGYAGAYVNFVADEGAERVRAAYPGETWDRLAAVKREYDPTNLFRLNQNIPPAD